MIEYSIFDSGTMYLGDCFEVMKTLPSASVDMVLCDLPYGTTQNKWDSVLPLDLLWKEYWRLATPTAAVVLTAQCPFDKVLGVSQLKHLKYEWIWQKSEATGHLNANKQPMKSHENVLVFYRQQCLYNAQKTTGHKLATVKRSSRSSTNYGAQRETAYSSDERYPLSIITCPKDNKNAKINPTQKPVAQFEYLLRTYTNEGDLVLDNTAGSGTTAIAAINAGRRWVCVERDPEYYAKACDRIRNHPA